MVPTFLKRLILIFAFFVGVKNIVIAQSFYKDYRTYLLNIGHHSAKQKKLIDTSVKRMRLTIDSFQKATKLSFFTVDTIFVVNFIAAETSFSSEIIWHRNASCFYQYNFEMDHWKIFNRKLDIKTDASDILKSFNNEFRRTIETGDTAGYHKFADKHKVFDGQWVDPIMAIKANNHWNFIVFKGNGWAINYEKLEIN